MNAITSYLKAHVALVGALATWALGTFPPNSTGYHVATAIMAVLTALGVVAVPNRPKARNRSVQVSKGKIHHKDAGLTAIGVLGAVCVAAVALALLGAGHPWFLLLLILAVVLLFV